MDRIERLGRVLLATVAGATVTSLLVRFLGGPDLTDWAVLLSVALPAAYAGLVAALLVVRAVRHRNRR